jgi:hypothetical protein
MNALARLAPAAAHVVISPDPAQLAAITDPAVNLAIWQRRLSPACRAEADRLAQIGAGDVRVTMGIDALGGALSSAMAAAGWPAAPALVADITALAAQAGALMATTGVDLRLEVVTGDACRKFHADYVPLRLITTYAGPGSQWLSNDDAAALAQGVAIEQLELQQLHSGEVAYFKGRVLSDLPIIHRSPPISGTGVRRLVLVINPAPEGGS